MKNKKEKIKDEYSEIAKSSSGCGCGSGCCGDDSKKVSKEIGYSDEEVERGEEANLGLGCGNPVAISAMQKGDTVIDFGSGAGFDCFLAAEKVGKEGRVIGIDMTKEMVEKARKNKKKRGLKNVEFVLAEIEKTSLEDNLADIIISNCVINLAPDKRKVFEETYRLLKSTGEMYISDIVLLEELSEEQKNDDDLLVGCVAGALLKENYLKIIENQGFEVEVLKEDKKISEKQYGGLPIESITLKIVKI